MCGKGIVVGTLTAALVVSSWLALRAQTAAPTQHPVFKTGVNYVEVDANVVDANGRFVEGLTKNDFTVAEDGQPQTVSVFSIVHIPVEARPAVSSNIRNVGPADAASNPPFHGRIFALVLDEQQTRFSAAPRVARAAEEFLTKYVGANDLVAVVSTGGRSPRD